MADNRKDFYPGLKKGFTKLREKYKPFYNK